MLLSGAFMANFIPQLFIKELHKLVFKKLMPESNAISNLT